MHCATDHFADDGKMISTGGPFLEASEILSVIAADTAALSGLVTEMVECWRSGRTMFAYQDQDEPTFDQ